MEEGEMHGWCHWAMLAHKDIVYHELHSGEVLELNE